MAISANWQSALDNIRQQMDKMEKTADGWTVPDDLRAMQEMPESLGGKPADPLNKTRLKTGVSHGA